MAKFLIIFALIVAYAAADCGYEDLKKCYNLENFFSDGKINWPQDDGAVQDLCGKLLEGGGCVLDFSNKCGKNDAAKKKFNERMAALKLYHTSVCGTPDGRKGFLERVQCYSHPGVEGPMREVHKKYVAMVEKIYGMDKGVRKQAFCCALLFVKDSAKGPVTANCKAETVEYLKNLLKLVSSSFKQECGDATEFTACAGALGGPGGDLTAIANGGPPTTENKLALPTLFKMWQES